jgi:hypothetical protein
MEEDSQYVLAGDTYKAHTDLLDATVMFIPCAEQSICHSRIQFQKVYFWNGCSKAFKEFQLSGVHTPHRKHSLYCCVT